MRSSTGATKPGNENWSMDTPKADGWETSPVSVNGTSAVPGPGPSPSSTVTSPRRRVGRSRSGTGARPRRRTDVSRTMTRPSPERLTSCTRVMADVSMVASLTSTRTGWAQAAWPGNGLSVNGGEVHDPEPSCSRTAKRGSGRSGSATTRRSMVAPGSLASRGTSGRTPATRSASVQLKENWAMAPRRATVVASGWPKNCWSGDQCISREKPPKPHGGRETPSTSAEPPTTLAHGWATPVSVAPAPGRTVVRFPPMAWVRTRASGTPGGITTPPRSRTSTEAWAPVRKASTEAPM